MSKSTIIISIYDRHKLLDATRKLMNTTRHISLFHVVPGHICSSISTVRSFVLLREFVDEWVVVCLFKYTH
jgi:hypothetical protein